MEPGVAVSGPIAFACAADRMGPYILILISRPDHPECFSCAEQYCRTSLLEHHYVVNGLPYCSRHADVHDSFLAKPHSANSSNRPPGSASSRSRPAPGTTNRALKRQTFITRA